MTTHYARNGAAPAAPARAATWYALPFDEAPPKFAPACADGDEVLVRTSSGREVLCTVDRRRGVYFVDADGDQVDAEAIAHPPTRHRSGKHARPRITVSVPAELHAQVTAVTDEEGISVSEWVCEAMRAYLLLSKRKDGRLTDADWRRVVSG